jgi:hypothetical protein
MKKQTSFGKMVACAKPAAPNPYPTATQADECIKRSGHPGMPEWPFWTKMQ